MTPYEGRVACYGHYMEHPSRQELLTRCWEILTHPKPDFTNLREDLDTLEGYLFDVWCIDKGGDKEEARRLNRFMDLRHAVDNVEYFRVCLEDYVRGVELNHYYE